LKKALIIDDEVDIVEILSSWLSEFGYETDTVYDVDAAMKLIDENEYFSVFCDLKMPGKTGADLLEYIKDVVPSLVRRFVLITGTILDDDLNTQIEVSGAHVLRKPFILKELETIVLSFEAE
jgi:CheY-like chemotaxis protein